MYLLLSISQLMVPNCNTPTRIMGKSDIAPCVAFLAELALDVIAITKLVHNPELKMPSKQTTLAIDTNLHIDSFIHYP